MAAKVDSLHAPVLWAQRKDKLYVTIALDDVKDPQIKLTETQLTFKGRGSVEKKCYENTIEFFKPVDPEESKYAVLPRNIPFMIKKKDVEEAFWPRLLKDKTKMHWLKTDFNKWKDEDDSDDGDDSNDQDLESMMQKMGGLGNMDNPMGMMNNMNMGGLDQAGDDEQSTDSDDEELPDLE